MKILLDENLPAPLKRSLHGHEAKTVRDEGWSGIKNGRLLSLAEGAFDAFLTADHSLPFQQNLHKRSIIVVVLVALDNTLGTLDALMPLVLEQLQTAQPGDVLHVKANEPR